MTQSTTEFSYWRSLLWPIYGHELKKIIPMLLMFFCISFNYTILRDTKDTLIVTAPGSGAEAIPFLKAGGVLPFAILFAWIYARMSNSLSKEHLFYATITPFIIFFALFATVLYPNIDYLHPHAFADFLQTTLPKGMFGMIAIIRNWTFALFYILSELWGSVVLSLLFWGFANDITKVADAKRFYSLFGLGANIALMVSGPAIVWASNLRKGLSASADPWQVSLNYLMAMVVLSGIVVIAAYRWINVNVLTDPLLYATPEVKKGKPKMSMMDSFNYLIRSKYLLCIALLVICYGMAINLVEVTWKSQLKLQYANPNDYSAFMGKFSTMTGLVTTIMILFVGSNTVRIFGWAIAAAATPVILGVTGVAFFGFAIYKEALAGWIATLGTTPLMLAVLFGAAQNILSKSTKYSLFDPTKEMTYIPLDQESKVKGKAAIDVVAARFGKSGGAVIQTVLLGIFGTLSSLAPFLALAVIGVIIVWIFAIFALDKQFQQLQEDKQAE